MLWSFQTGAGANDTVVGLRAGREAVRRVPVGGQLADRLAARRQPVAVLAGRDDGPGTGPGRWLRHRARRPGRRQQGGGQTTADAAAGKTVFSDNCAGCHGVDGTGGNGGPDLTAIPSAKDCRGRQKQVDERRRWDAGVQGKLTAAADQGRHRVRDAGDHEQVAGASIPSGRGRSACSGRPLLSGAAARWARLYRGSPWAPTAESGTRSASSQSG